MPVSKELGVDLLGRRPGDFLVSVPIKKRKCYFVRSPSPPRMPSLLPRVSDGDLLKKDQSNSDLEMPVLDRKDPDSNANLSDEKSIGLNHGHSGFLLTSSSNVELGCKGKLNSESELTFQQVDTNLGLFSQKEPLGQPKIEEMSEGKPIMNNKSAGIEVSGSIELHSALKEPPGLSIEGQNVGGSCPKQEKSYQSPQAPVERCFDIHHDKLKDPTVSREQDNVQTKGSPMKSEVDCTHLHEKRSLWDLNTTMDTWEGSSSTAVSLNHPSDGMNVLDPSQIYDIKPFLCSKEMQDSNVTFRTCIHDGSKDSKQSFDFLSHFNQEAACSFIKRNLRKSGFDESTSEKLMVPGNMAFAEHKLMKSEQFELGGQGGFRTVESCNKLIYLRSPKPEVSDGIGQEGIQDVVGKNLILVNPGGIKVEPVEEGSQVHLKAAEGLSQLPDIHKLTPELPVSGDVAQKASETIVNALYFVPESMNPDATESVVTSEVFNPECQYTVDAAQTATSEVFNPECSASISIDAVHVESSAVTGAAESDDNEKINLSADIREDDPCDSDFESGSFPNVDTVMRHNHNDDDIEDGEVREPLVHDTSVEGICEEGETGLVSKGDLGNREGCGDPGGDGVMISSQVECKDCATKNPMETVSASCTGGDDRALFIEKKEQCSSTDRSLKKSSVSAGSTSGSGKKRPIKAVKMTPHGCTEEKEHGLKGHESTSDQAISASASHETITDDGKDKSSGKQDGIKGSSDMDRVKDSNFPKTEPSLRVDEANRNEHSWIFNLSKASNGSSPGRMRSIHSGPVVLETESVRSHSSLRVDELHPRGSRDEGSMDVNRKFVRGRNIDRITGNSGPGFMHKRKWVDNCSETLQCDQDFASKNYSTLAGARFSRPKNIDVGAAAEFQRSGHAIASDGNLVTSGKAWRKHMHDELESSRHLPFRRRSPCGREGPIALGARVVPRPVRVNIPDRCVGRGGPDMVVVRREEKFMRELPDDMMDPLLSHSRSQYQRVHDPFIRRERSFSPVQRHDFLHVARLCSKSPPRSRTPSPCSWPSPIRSPDRFNGHPELLLRRSPPVFRGERVRSPHQRPGFADAMMLRRHGSTPHIPHLPDDMRKIGPSRPFILTRSPSGRILQRSIRRFNMRDPQERAEGDEYFGPMQSDHLHEFVVDDCVSDRTKFRERCKPVRSFRPHDEGGDIERFRYREDGSRPYRFRPGGDVEFQNRENPREFEERIINRLGNPRRPRILEEKQDERLHGPEWGGEASFNDAPRLRRGRF